MTHSHENRRRVALIQSRPRLGDIAANTTAIEHSLAAHPDADIMVWPELFLGGYTTTEAATTARAIESPDIRRLAGLARRYDTAMVVGFAEQRETTIANSALAIDRDGTLAGCYRKTQLFGAESGVYSPGDALTVVSLSGVTCGLMICFDIEFPEVARALATNGADLLISISANMPPFAADHRLCVQARALENRRPHVYVNQIGQGETFWFTGQSAVADTTGQIVAEHVPDTEAGLVVDVDLSVETEIRPDYLAQRRVPLPVER
ncbi:nitrilase-related carbon-nitrogen hydrolase [uncultured Salinisphaera sp.]|uniref:nitrilase-related carbon-nitrogen hydrolase n=1 Tax=uncultured Salinisphaera sp. TaxID=359372 RepID=UPI0032B25CC2|tara:strand:+ start:367 stop:1158 length:792 start_codon:yes stop_codon:yes gene_type:complete